MDTMQTKRQDEEIAQLVEAQARGALSADLELPTEQDAPQDAELDLRVSKYGPNGRICCEPHCCGNGN